MKSSGFPSYNNKILSDTENKNIIQNGNGKLEILVFKLSLLNIM